MRARDDHRLPSCLPDAFRQMLISSFRTNQIFLLSIARVEGELCV